MSKFKSNAKAEFAAKLVGHGFLLAARRLREVQDDAPGEFALVAKLLKIGYRKACYLAAIDRAFRDLGVDEAILNVVGWSKLRVLCDHVNAENCDHLLKIAAGTSTQDLKRILKHEPPPPTPHCTILYFSDDDYATFAKAILAHGGSKKGKGLVNKEAALIAALSAADKSTADKLK